MSILKQCLVLIAWSLAASFSSVTAAEYYVAPGGTGDGTIDLPFGSIDDALAIVQPHDVITLRTGIYNAPFYPNDDYINTPHLTIQGFPGERPHIKSDYGNGKKITLWIGAEAEHMTLRNLEISGGDVYTIKLDTYWDWPAGGNHRARNVTIEDCEIHHSGTDIIKITPEADDAKILNSQIHHSGLYYTSGDYLKDGVTEQPNCQGIDNVNADRMLVKGNHIHDICFDNPAVFFKGGATDVVVERNKMENAYTGVMIGGQTDIDFYSPDENPAPHYNSFNGVVRNNIISNMRGDCITLLAAKDPKVYNNTLMDCGIEVEGKGISFRHQPTWGDNGAMNQPTVNAFIVNNLVTSKAAGSNQYGDFLIEVRGYSDNNILAVEPGSLMMDNNIYWDSRYSDLRVRNFNNYSAGTKDYSTLAEWQDSPLHNTSYADRHTFYGDPQVDTLGNLQAGSAAIGTGIAVEGLTEDYYGKARSSSIDIGAVAYAGLPATQPPSGRAPPTSDGNLYENAEDGKINGWKVYDMDPEAATISNVYDEDKQSNVIALKGEETNNGFILGHWRGDDAWNNTEHKTVSWSMNYSEAFYVYISVQTNKGHRYLYYDGNSSDNGLSHDGEYIHHGLGSQANNGTWQTFTRDLEKDLKEFESDNEILSVNAFLVRGSGLLDDIGLGVGQGRGSAKDVTNSKIKLPPAGSYYHGTYPGGRTGEEDDILPEDVADYERAIGKRAAWVYFSNNWYRSRTFPEKTATWITNRGSIPFIRIMTRSSADQLDEDPTTQDPVFTLDAINNGDFDDDFKAWGVAAKAFGQPLIVEWGTEMNGFWFAWNGVHNGGVAGPEKFRRAYRRIIEIIKSQGADNITWVFHANWDDDPNEDSDPSNTWNKLEAYYPGHDVIDWLGVSIYSAQRPVDDYWTNFTEQMDEVYPRITIGEIGQGNKPIMLLEFGAAANNPNGKQARWAEEALNNILSDRWPRLKGFSWWNEKWENGDGPETNMRVQDNPDLKKVIRETFDRESEFVVTRPVH